MHSKNIAPQLRTNLDIKSEEYQKNKKVMLEKLDFIDDLLDQAELGGGTYHHERLAKRGKMPIRERIMNVIDDDSPFLEISPFAGYLYSIHGSFNYYFAYIPWMILVF